MPTTTRHRHPCRTRMRLPMRRPRRMPMPKPMPMRILLWSLMCSVLVLGPLRVLQCQAQWIVSQSAVPARYPHHGPYAPPRSPCGHDDVMDAAVAATAADWSDMWKCDPGASASVCRPMWKPFGSLLVRLPSCSSPDAAGRCDRHRCPWLGSRRAGSLSPRSSHSPSWRYRLAFELTSAKGKVDRRLIGGSRNKK